jgi:hypothetical protein
LEFAGRYQEKPLKIQPGQPVSGTKSEPSELRQECCPLFPLECHVGRQNTPEFFCVPALIYHSVTTAQCSLSVAGLYLYLTAAGILTRIIK